MANDESIDDRESLRRLRSFLKELRTLLADIVDHPRPVIPGRLHADMKAAWSSVDRRFDVAARSLKNLKPAQTNALRNAGLVGKELEFKLAVFAYRRDELMDHGTAKEGQGKKRSWWKRFLGLLKPTLKAADVILGSLASAPLGLAASPFEAIKEYKEAVESGAELGWKAAK